MKTRQIIQLRTDVPNPVLGLGGYTPTTDYWAKAIRLTNALIEANDDGANAEQLQKGANVTIKARIFDEAETHTPVEWAEFVMAINHVLWLWHDLSVGEGVEIDQVLQALDALYYEWHDKALNTLKGDELSTYLRITD